MTFDQSLDLVGSFTLLFGVAYALFGTGPRIDFVPRWLMFVMRLLYPGAMLVIWVCQEASRSHLMEKGE